ncbi:MAG: phosphomannomutase/phosphoglucomutase, partial [bacterium]
FKENHFLDDGAYLVAKILIKMANIKARNNRKLSDLITDLDEVEISKEYRMKIQLDDFKDYGQQVLEELKTHINENTEWQIAPKNYEGVRVDCGANDWFLLRMSLHDPVLVLNIECDEQKKLNLIKNSLQQFLGNYSKINKKQLL